MELSDMNFRVEHSDFAEAVSWVAKNIPNRPSMPILAGILLQTDDKGLTISGFDYEISTEITIPAEVMEEGRVVVSGRLLADISNTLPHKTAHIQVDGAKLRISCGSAKFTLPTLPTEDFPRLPQLPTHTGSVPSDLLAEAVAQVQVAAGRDNSVPMLTGMRMEIDGIRITLASTDRFRLAVRTLEWHPFGEEVHDVGVLIPAKILHETTKTLASTSSAPVELALGNSDAIGGEGLLGLVGENRRITSRLIDSKFVPFRQLFPPSYSFIATLDVADLQACCKRVSLMAERGAQIRLSFTENDVTVTAGADDSGQAEETLPAVTYGEPMSIAFNPNLLTDGLSALTTSKVSFGMVTPQRPSVLVEGIEEEPVKGEDGMFPALEADFRYLVMPVRV